MRTANNTNSNYTVENLVAKYRNYVNEHCPTWFDEIDGKDYPDTYGSMETLLLSLYRKNEGENADSFILKALEPYAHYFSDYYKDAFTESEFAFLAENFSSFIDCTISSYCDGHIVSKPSRVELIKKYLNPKENSTIFLANTGCDVACLFPNCKLDGYFCEEENQELWAIGKILLLSKGVSYNLQTSLFYDFVGYRGVTLPKEGSVDYLIYGAHEDVTYDDILALYKCVASKGRMLIFVDKSSMQGKDEKYHELRKILVKDKAISSLIAYQDINPTWNSSVNRLLLVIDKAGNDFVNIESLCSNRKCTIPAANLNPAMLWPGYYFAIRPENGLPLSKLCFAQSKSAREDYKQFKERLGGKIHWEVTANGERLALPDWVLNLPIASQSEMSNEYRNANLCNKDLPHVSDPGIDEWRNRIRIVDKPCIILSGGYKSQKRFVLGYYDNIVGDGYARMSGQPCLYPQDDVDVRYLAAILLIPSVYEQILSICDEDYLFGSNLHHILDLVIVPNHDEKERLAFLVEANYDAMLSSQKEMEKAFEEKLALKKAEYINEVRMRKHDMGQYIFEMINIEDLMRYYIENRETEKNFCTEIINLLDNLKCSLKELDSLLKNLSQEELFNEPDNNFNINEFLLHLKDRHKTENYKITYENDKQSIIDYWHLQGIDFSMSEDMSINERDVKKMVTPPSLQMSSVDFARMVQNILDNARKHGFTELDRKDYEVHVHLSIDNKNNMYLIDFLNNGKPLPKGIDKMRYGLRGEKAGINGGSGIGGDYVRSFVEHYNGDYDVFMKDDWVVIRIMLPIK